ncbi:LytTR family DNA-binding domain-containing protein [Roseibium sp.]|uniref:LytTR family DNA-binding domain-containing protein n=1 Tax=Roseibium sp. TaxID=1936156 RepID=UPI003A96DC9B
MNETHQNFADGRPLQLALREMHGLFSDRRTYAIALGIICLLTLSGPFGTSDGMSLPARLLFWSLIVASGFGIGNLTGSMVGHTLRLAGFARPLCYALAGFAAGLAVLPAILILNLIFFQADLTNTDYLLRQLLNCLIIGGVVALNLAIFSRNSRTSPDPQNSSVETSPVLDRLQRRLPVEKRSPLRWLSVSDHYVEVATLKGQELLLLRLKDAIEEIDQTDGLQIHRSHWVAKNAIEKVSRENGKTLIHTSDGPILPVSRTYLPELKARGLLPSSR